MYKYYVRERIQYFDGGSWQVRCRKVSETFDSYIDVCHEIDRFRKTPHPAHVSYDFTQIWVEPPKPLCRKVESRRHYEAFGGNYGYSETRIYESIREYYRSENWG